MISGNLPVKDILNLLKAEYLGFQGEALHAGDFEERLRLTTQAETLAKRASLLEQDMAEWNNPPKTLSWLQQHNREVGIGLRQKIRQARTWKENPQAHKDEIIASLEALNEGDRVERIKSQPDPDDLISAIDTIRRLSMMKLLRTMGLKRDIEGFVEDYKPVRHHIAPQGDSKTMIVPAEESPARESTKPSLWRRVLKFLRRTQSS